MEVGHGFSQDLFPFFWSFSPKGGRVFLPPQKSQAKLLGLSDLSGLRFSESFPVKPEDAFRGRSAGTLARPMAAVMDYMLEGEMNKAECWKLWSPTPFEKAGLTGLKKPKHDVCLNIKSDKSAAFRIPFSSMCSIAHSSLRADSLQSPSDGVWPSAAGRVSRPQRIAASEAAESLAFTFFFFGGCFLHTAVIVCLPFFYSQEPFRCKEGKSWKVSKYRFISEQDSGE